MRLGVDRHLNLVLLKLFGLLQEQGLLPLYLLIVLLVFFDELEALKSLLLQFAMVILQSLHLFFLQLLFLLLELFGGLNCRCFHLLLFGQLLLLDYLLSLQLLPLQPLEHLFDWIVTGLLRKVVFPARWGDIVQVSIEVRCIDSSLVHINRPIESTVTIIALLADIGVGDRRIQSDNTVLVICFVAAACLAMTAIRCAYPVFNSLLAESGVKFAIVGVRFIQVNELILFERNLR